MKKRLGPTDILFPVPAALVAAGTVKKPSVVTIAWIGMMASNPPVLAVSVKKSRHSLSIIKAQQEFTVNIPSANHFVETDFVVLSPDEHTTSFVNVASRQLHRLW